MKYQNMIKSIRRFLDDDDDEQDDDEYDLSDEEFDGEIIYQNDDDKSKENRMIAIILGAVLLVMLFIVIIWIFRIIKKLKLQQQMLENELKRQTDIKLQKKATFSREQKRQSIIAVQSVQKKHRESQFQNPEDQSTSVVHLPDEDQTQKNLKKESPKNIRQLQNTEQVQISPKNNELVPEKHPAFDPAHYHEKQRNSPCKVRQNSEKLSPAHSQLSGRNVNLVQLPQDNNQLLSNTNLNRDNQHPSEVILKSPKEERRRPPSAQVDSQQLLSHNNLSKHDQQPSEVILKSPKEEKRRPPSAQQDDEEHFEIL